MPGSALYFLFSNTAVILPCAALWVDKKATSSVQSPTFQRGAPRLCFQSPCTEQRPGLPSLQGHRKCFSDGPEELQVKTNKQKKNHQGLVQAALANIPAFQVDAGIGEEQWLLHSSEPWD